MTDLGTVFPPRDQWDIAAYDIDEMIFGYVSYEVGDPAPGANHSPAYRWGWTNRHKDVTGQSDGFEDIRSAFIRMMENPQ